jgi:RNA polymerase sigma-70 factor (ECF subfamily)
MRSASDEELIDRARQGDVEAFNALARKHEGPLRALIAIELGDGIRGRVEVDDILQETLLRAFRSFAGFAGRNGDSLRIWLAGIAHHAVVDEARRLTAKKHDYRREEALPAEPGRDGKQQQNRSPELPSPAPSPSRILRRKERFERLLDSIEALSPDHRQVIILTRIEQLPIKEVAARMERSEKAVSMLLLRALLALRSVFGETESGGLPSSFSPRALLRARPGEN